MEKFACLSTSAIVRISFVLACFHFMVFLAILARTNAVAYFHDSCWCFKVFLVLLFFILSLFIPNPFFLGYSYFARYASAFFLFAQAVVMMLAAYKINEVLVQNVNREQEAG